MLACSHTNTPCRKVRACSHKTRLATKETGDQPKNWRATTQEPQATVIFNLGRVLLPCGNYTLEPVRGQFAVEHLYRGRVQFTSVPYTVSEVNR